MCVKKKNNKIKKNDIILINTTINERKYQNDETNRKEL